MNACCSKKFKSGCAVLKIPWKCPTLLLTKLMVTMPFYSVPIDYAWGDCDVILPAILVPAMLEVYYVAAVQFRKRTYACNLLCVELYAYQSKTVEMGSVSITIFRLSHFKSARSIPPTWRRGFVLSSTTPFHLMHTLHVGSRIVSLGDRWWRVARVRFAFWVHWPEVCDFPRRVLKLWPPRKLDAVWRRH